MLVSPATNDYSTSTTPSSSASQSFRARIRTLNVCEPSFPSRDVVRQENYARRKAQEFQGWACPRTIPYQNIGPAHVPPQTPKPIIVRILIYEIYLQKPIEYLDNLERPTNECNFCKTSIETSE
jgi:hypothetical protein